MDGEWVTHVVQALIYSLLLVSSRHTRATFSVLHIALIHVFIPCFSKSSRTYEGKAEVRAVVLGMEPKSPTMVMVCAEAVVPIFSTRLQGHRCPVALLSSVVAGTPATDPDRSC